MLRIKGDVVGQVSNGKINNFGPVHFHERPLTEIELQAMFYEKAGFWCPKGAREIFEMLVEHHHFRVDELRLSWKTDSLQWNVEDGRLLTVTPALELVYAVIAFLVFGSYSLIMFFGVLAAATPSQKAVSVAVFFVLMVVVNLGINKLILVPRRVAKRIRKILDEQSDGDENA